MAQTAYVCQSNRLYAVKNLRMGKPESKSFLKVKAEKNYKCENAKMLQNIFSYNYIHIKVYICILLQM